MVLIKFQCRGDLLIWTIVGRGPTALAVGADGAVLTFSSRQKSFFFLFLWETAIQRLKYCLKGPFNPK